MHRIAPAPRAAPHRASCCPIQKGKESKDFERDSAKPFKISFKVHRPKILFYSMLRLMRKALVAKMCWLFGCCWGLGFGEIGLLEKVKEHMWKNKDIHTAVILSGTKIYFPHSGVKDLHENYLVFKAAMAGQAKRKLVSVIDIMLVLVLVAMVVHSMQVSTRLSYQIFEELISDSAVAKTTLFLSAYLVVRFGYKRKNTCENILLWFTVVEIASSSILAVSGNYLVGIIIYFLM